MLSLSKNDITMQQMASNKQDAIKALAADLEATGLVQTGYVNGMLAREQQNSTYLGNGIAIPHGTTETRDLVNHTGVKIHHFPQGVPWGNDQTAYIAIGIAAKSDEHLGILKQLTKVLSADGMEEKLRRCESEQAIIGLLNGDEQQEAECNPELILQQFPAQDLLQLTAVAAGLIKYQGFAETATVTDAINQGATYLGQGLWLVKSNKQVKRTAIAVVTPQVPFEELGHPVTGMIMVAANNMAHKANLEHLTNLIYQGKVSQWLASSAQEMVTALTQVSLEGSQATFAIRNPHGLHARPGAMLVNTTKKFDANIQVVNITSDSKPVNAKSLMKVIGLGVKCGHELQFTAQGSDAEAALIAIGQAIADGLGEKL
ncbi:bifunctional PTS fructose transporter subunit IIA/HPr protein [Photobacterium phosphoreum]|uniref:fused PTS fructose transporter subunit IIA/HPr protein n=1 Tax=Photobacterium phosphoreum TaxID=659 RepID=UPI000D1523C2|nr:fused PTS fructose transporter subunit IIA/HPr protein [Photobacterium phosphoreum]PSU69267.1 bifunctional PTS fructose transporter subunit IIA/HPr protein [Photobacterium phosphoreum]